MGVIKCVFIDIDGTLINSKREVTEKTKRLVGKCVENGIKVILVSGRSRCDTLKYQREIAASPYVITSNGADTYDIEKNKVIYSKPMEKEILVKLLKYSIKNGCKIVFNCENEIVMNKTYYQDEKGKDRTEVDLLEIIQKKEIAQCVIFNEDIEILQQLKEYLKLNLQGVKIENESKRLKNIELKPSKHYYCDIVMDDVSKGLAIENLCKYLKIDKKDITVIGDGENDVSMFEVSNYSVAMGNAVDELKKKADYITDDNDNDGVANFLEKILQEKNG